VPDNGLPVKVGDLVCLPQRFGPLAGRAGMVVSVEDDWAMVDLGSLGQLGCSASELTGTAAAVPTIDENVYQAAAVAYDAAISTELRIANLDEGTALGPNGRANLAGHGAFRAAVESACAAGRAAAANDIRAELSAERVRLNVTDPKKVSPLINNWLGGIGLAARIAEGRPQ